MKRLYVAVFITCSVIAAGVGQLRAEATEARVALVVGNAAYRTVAPLKNPVNDAHDMAKALQELGFDVIRVEDANKQQLEHAINEFGSKLSKANIGLFYYSGHGMQENGHNYLIPVDANVATEAAVMLEATDLDLVLQRMNMAQTRVSLVILDACRNNPFERRFRAVGRGLAPVERTLGGTLVAPTAPGKIAAEGDGANGHRFRALGSGLAPIGQTPRGILVAYSTAPGKIAEDGDGANGLYTAELLKAMRVPGLKVEDVFKAVRVAVSAASSDEQIPWESSSLTGDFFFTPPAPVAATLLSAVGPETSDIAFWNSVEREKSPSAYADYLKAFPNGRFVSLAKLKIAKLSAMAPQHVNQAPSDTSTAVSPRPSVPFEGSEAAFRCPPPGTLVEYNTGTSMLFIGAKGFGCAYRKENGDEAEKFGGLVDTARFIDAGLGKLWPLKVGGEQRFSMGRAGERFTVLRQETLTVDAGTFDTFVIEQEESDLNGQNAKRLFWYVPERGVVIQSKFIRLANRYWSINVDDAATMLPGDYEAVRITSAVH